MRVHLVRCDHCGNERQGDEPPAGWLTTNDAGTGTGPQDYCSTSCFIASDPSEAPHG